MNAESNSEPQWYDLTGNFEQTGKGTPPSTLKPLHPPCLSEADRIERDAFRNGTWEPPKPPESIPSGEPQAAPIEQTAQSASIETAASPESKPEWTLERIAAAQDTICDALAKGETLKAICKPAAMPTVQRVWVWARGDNAFAQRFRECREIAAELLAEECVPIADEAKSFVQSQLAKLQIDTRMRRAAQLKPSVFREKGDTTNVNVGVSVGITMNEARRAELIAKRRAYLEGAEKETQSE